MSKIHCQGCGQHAEAQKAVHPYYRKKMEQCTRCLTFEKETAPVPLNFGGPLQHSLTYSKHGGYGLGVMKMFEQELPFLQRAGWMVQSTMPSGQVRMWGKVEPAMLVVMLVRVQSAAAPPMQSGPLPSGFPPTGFPGTR